MKNIIFMFIILWSVQVFASAEVDINIIHERSSFEVKETICGWTPDPEKGFLEDDNGCFYTTYKMDAPVYGFDFRPRMEDVLQPARVAYYVQFLGPNIPAEQKLHAEVTSGGNKNRDIVPIFHDNTLQGVGMLKTGENIRIYSDKEPSYIYIYVIAVVVIITGLTLIVRRRK